MGVRAHVAVQQEQSGVLKAPGQQQRVRGTDGWVGGRGQGGQGSPACRWLCTPGGFKHLLPDQSQPCTDDVSQLNRPRLQWEGLLHGCFSMKSQQLGAKWICLWFPLW